MCEHIDHVWTHWSCVIMSMNWSVMCDNDVNTLINMCEHIDHNVWTHMTRSVVIRLNGYLCEVYLLSRKHAISHLLNTASSCLQWCESQVRTGNNCNNNSYLHLINIICLQLKACWWQLNMADCLFIMGKNDYYFLMLYIFIFTISWWLITCMYVYSFTFSWYCHYLPVDKGIIQT